ncbi:hypothetical protein immuto35A_212 [Flavobacterium phage vB_FspM_immuto_3-5A]|uniref:Uncharacterized protein n=1 Tax=Flavobacterium phage vB_FspM_immuto_2-6A TaxID=2801477 RepID=A0A7T8IX17_9CAUD|nr:hypothetical protein KNV73_gp058 [Flavobacterium phage vB_FspM_immuto_2-6A]QQO91892.1 hypothetical protein immuto26A_213 [Flavobacterium phage vB_FspM_immuto_2-6A]QQO92130.1 hypothetical protein immuto35A_212 [Flavobacterium phage vB_FspM_immuto_3-5A]QQO92368.1 hypothetical protein immuto136C_212 [Flavobacterium phage vB_FspM_immuto_13-6C]
MFLRSLVRSQLGCNSRLYLQIAGSLQCYLLRNNLPATV